MLTETLIRYKLKAEQPVSYFCQDRLPLIVCHFSLCVSTISQKSHYVLMPHLHETLHLLDEFLLMHIKCVIQLLHSNHTIYYRSLDLWLHLSA